MTELFRDLRYAARTLVKNPGVSLMAVGALGLGIGLTATMFSIVYGTLYRGLPFEDAERIVHLERTNPEAAIESMEVTVHDYVDWREQQTAFTDLAAFYTGTVNVRGSERAIRFDGGFMTANAFRLLGVGPVVGRGFQPEDDRPGAARVMLVGHRVWEERFDGDPGVVGRSVTVNGETGTIVGVMPEDFLFPFAQEVWVNLRPDPLGTERGEGTTLEVFGRLRDGISLDRAAVEMNQIARRLAEAHPETNEGIGVAIKPFTDEFIGEEPARLLWVMMGAVAAVLLIACTNVANLLLARTALRTREVAIRSAMGASRRRLLLQLLSESFALSLAGAALGAGLAWVGIRAFDRAVAPVDMPFWLEYQLDAPVLLFVTGITVVAAMVSGVIPAVQATRGDVTEILKDESRGSSSLRIGRLSRGLVVAEVAFSMGLLVAAGLMTKSVVQLRTFDYPFLHENVFTARVGLFEADYPDAAERRRFFDRVEERLAGLPGAEAVTVTNNLPGLNAWPTPVTIEGRSYGGSQDYPTAFYTISAPSFFRTFGVEVLRGRGLGPEDQEGSLPVAVVNRSFAAKHFPGEDPLGKRFRLGRGDSDEPWLTVVGVVPDLYMQGLGNPEDEDGSGFYIPLAQSDLRFASLAIRAGSAPLSLTAAVRDAVAAVDPDLPLYWVDTLDGRIAEATWFYRVFGTLFMVFGAVALFLASVGLYGVMAFGVSRRSHEVGIRMALGARGGDVVRMVVRQGLVQVGFGLGLGLGLALVIGRGLQLVLFDVEPQDPAVISGIALLLMATGLLASLLPASRATRVDPVDALRAE